MAGYEVRQGRVWGQVWPGMRSGRGRNAAYQLPRVAWVKPCGKREGIRKGGSGAVRLPKILVLPDHVADRIMTTVKKPPLSGSGYSGYPPGMVPGMRKRGITPHWGCL